MKWRRKAFLQNLIAMLPDKLSQATYYLFQRNFGALRSINPINDLKHAVQIMKHISELGYSIESKKFLEIGTGRRINVPVALWLCGASEITTVDINPYLKEELVINDFEYIKSHQDEVLNLFNDLSQISVIKERFKYLLESEDSLAQILDCAGIHYLAPADATCLDLSAGTIDYCFSYSVLQYVPKSALIDMLVESRRLVNNNGLFLHYIDLTDHFAHSDPSITNINFLRFSEHEWNTMASNRYMYHSRLRIDDYLALFNDLQYSLLLVDTSIDERSMKALAEGFVLDERFRDKDFTTNATCKAWIVAKDRNEGS